MDEKTVVARARKFVREAGPLVSPPSIELFARHIGGVIRIESDLPKDQPGFSLKSKGKYIICVNEKDSEKRRRFTACHEIAHAVLQLPSQHSVPWWSYAKRPKNEVLCDVFAAELLLPKTLFEPLVQSEPIRFSTIDKLGQQFMASTTATGSRYAFMMDAPCAFVISEQGVVRYASRSKLLREAGGWIQPGLKIPLKTPSAHARAMNVETGADEVAADVWFDDWPRGGVILEESRHLEPWDQTLTLLWFEDEEVLPLPRNAKRGMRNLSTGGGDPLLNELDGILPWPGKSRRR